jgi:hypothetical protein
MSLLLHRAQEDAERGATVGFKGCAFDGATPLGYRVPELTVNRRDDVRPHEVVGEGPLSQSKLKLSRRRKFGILIALAALLLFLVPFVTQAINLCPPEAFCPVEAVNHTAKVSVVYYAFGVGGRLIGSSYQILVWPGWICHDFPNGVTCRQLGWVVT